MSKLYFKYGVMGSSKSAMALMTKFNYEQKGFNVLLLKSVLDTRDYEGKDVVVRSRIGLYSKCFVFSPDDSLAKMYNKYNKIKKIDAVIVDECQFATARQVDELHEIALTIPVICFGLLTDFTTHLFEGSKRLVEVAESLQELKTVCACGDKASVNARFVDGEIAIDGDVVAIEQGRVTYEPMCYRCFINLVRNRLDNKPNN